MDTNKCEYCISRCLEDGSEIAVGLQESLIQATCDDSGTDVPRYENKAVYRWNGESDDRI